MVYSQEEVSLHYNVMKTVSVGFYELRVISFEKDRELVG